MPSLASSSLTRRRFLAWGSAGTAVVGAGSADHPAGVRHSRHAGQWRRARRGVPAGRGGRHEPRPPYGDGDYAGLRPTIAIPRPGQAGGALDLNGFFGMHPAMRTLYEGPWARGDLAVVNAAGWHTR